jgi:hypothetical protein
VLVHTGWDRYRGSERYGTDHPFPTAVAADWLAEQQIALAGINSAADRRVPAREPGAGQITESDVEPGQPCDRIAEYSLLIGAGGPVSSERRSGGSVRDAVRQGRV